LPSNGDDEKVKFFSSVAFLSNYYGSTKS